MAKANRETLKGYFSNGKMPTGSQFGDLVDSMLNIVDDGMNRTGGNGLQLSPLEENSPVLEFYSGILDDKPLWEIRVDRKREALELSIGGDDIPLLTLFPDRKISLNGDVEVSGTVSAAGFLGNYRCGEVLADGKWYDVTDEDGANPSGCRAYRIVAGCGRKGKGKYALTEATAIQCYGEHKKVYYRQSWFGMHFNRLKFRWHQEGKAWRLQMRSRCNYGKEAVIRFRITELWQDYYMGE